MPRKLMDLEQSSYTSNPQLLDKLLHDFSAEILMEVQNFICRKYRMPSSFWGVRGSKVEPQYSRFSHLYYPSFCLQLHQFAKEKSPSECEIHDTILFSNLASNPRTNLANKYLILKCRFGLDRLVFPIHINTKLLGFLVLGKFSIKGRNGGKFITECLAKEMIETDSFLLEEKISDNKEHYFDLLNREIKKIPTLHRRNIKKITNEVYSMLPLVESIHSHATKEAPICNAISTFEHIEKQFLTPINSITKLHEVLNSTLSELLDKFKAESIAVFTAKGNTSLQFENILTVPINTAPANSIFNLNSSKSFDLLSSQSFTLIPTESPSLNWLNDEICTFSMTTPPYLSSWEDQDYQNKSGSQKAILFAKELVGHLRYIIILYIKDDYDPLSLHHELTSVAIERIISNVNKGLYSLNIDEVMTELGHMLQRSTNSVDSGITYILQHVKSNTNYQLQQNVWTETSEQEIEDGITKLSLIARNYKLFRRIKNTEYSPDIEDSHVNILDVFEFITNRYSYASEVHQKTIIYNILPQDRAAFALKLHKESFETIFFNAFDNAFKFSPNGHNIYIDISIQNDCFLISITNTNNKTNHFDITKVWDTFYKGQTGLKGTKIEGSGLGLGLTKRLFELYFKSGKIEIHKFPKDKSDILHGHIQTDKHDELVVFSITIPRVLQ